MSSRARHHHHLHCHKDHDSGGDSDYYHSAFGASPAAVSEMGHAYGFVKDAPSESPVQVDQYLQPRITEDLSAPSAKLRTVRAIFNFATTPAHLAKEAGDGSIVISEANKRLKFVDMPHDIQKSLADGTLRMLPVRGKVSLAPNIVTTMVIEMPAIKARPGETAAFEGNGNIEQVVTAAELKSNNGSITKTMLNRSLSAADHILLQNFTPYLADIGKSMYIPPSSPVALMPANSPVHYYFCLYGTPADSPGEPMTPLQPDEAGIVKMPLEAARIFFEEAKNRLQADVPLIDAKEFSVRVSPMGYTDPSGEYVPGSFNDPNILFMNRQAPQNWMDTRIHFQGEVILEFLPVGVATPGK